MASSGATKTSHQEESFLVSSWLLFLCPEISLYGVFSNEVLLSQRNNNSLYYFLGDMKIETILKFHIILLTMAITRNTITTNADMDVIKGEFFYTFCRSVKYCKQFGNQSGGLWKWPKYTFLSIYAKDSIFFWDTAVETQHIHSYCCFTKITRKYN